MLATVVSILVPVHFYVSKADAEELLQWIFSVFHVEDFEVDSLKESRIEEEMMKLRQRNYKLFTRCCAHLAFVVGITFAHQAIKAPELNTIAWTVCSILGYTHHMMFGQGVIELTPCRLKFLCWLSHLMAFFLFICAGLGGSAGAFSMVRGFLTAVRFVVILTFLDPSVSIPFQVMYTTLNILVYVFCIEQSSVPWAPFCCDEFFTLVITIACSASIDLLLRGRVVAKLDSADAESLVSSFRRMLRGVCDGELLLDSQMKVAQESDCLKNLILTDVSLMGRSFEHLLADKSEQQRFSEFIDASTRKSKCRALHSSPDPCAHPCLRLYLRGSAGIRVGANIYHVAVPGLFGALKPYHLIAFKEDLDSCPPDAAEDAVPTQLLANSLEAQMKPDGHSATSESAVSSCHCCPELQQMALLVDLDTELHDVQEARLRFRRQGSDVPSRPQSNMPSVRTLVMATDWPEVEENLQRFSELCLNDPGTQPQILKKQLPLQLPMGERAIATEAFLQPHPRPRKVWLHLTGLRPWKARQSMRLLNRIQEGERVNHRQRETGTD